MKKDKSSFFDQETRSVKNNPGPGTYEVRKMLTKEEEAELA